jgi:hypothetical protein
VTIITTKKTSYHNYHSSKYISYPLCQIDSILHTRILRGSAIALLGFAVVFTALSAWGTVCVAWNAEKWPSFAALIPLKWVYQVLVYLNVLATFGGVVAIYAFLRGKKWSYTSSLIILVAYLATAAAQMSLTSTLKHVSFFSTPPTNIRFYTTAIVLGFFLLLKMTGTTRRAGFDSRASPSFIRKSAGLSLIVAGVMTLTTFLWVGPSHIIDGYNLVSVFGVQLTLGGGAMSVIGTSLLTLSNSQACPSSRLRNSQSTPILSWLRNKKV